MLAFVSCSAQKPGLRSYSHGLDMMVQDIPKEQLISEMRFEGKRDELINVIRLDQVFGPTNNPLIISSLLPVATDSLGILAIKLESNILTDLLERVDRVNAKTYTREIDFVLIRVTYRFEGNLGQYYVTNRPIVIGVLQMFEKKLKESKNVESLDIFYRFVGPTNLLSVRGKWKD